METSNGNGLPKEPIIVNRMDCLEISNLHLRIMNLAQRETMLNSQLLELQESRAKLQQELLDKRVATEVKYGIDLTTHDIQVDNGGAVVPKGAQAVQMTQLLQKFQQGISL